MNRKLTLLYLGLSLGMTCQFGLLAQVNPLAGRRSRLRMRQNAKSTNCHG